MKPSHRRHDRSWRPAPKAWYYRKHRVWPDGVTVAHILKTLWPQSRLHGKSEKIMEVPPWAQLARDRHWMTEDAFQKTPKEWRGRMTVAFDMFGSSPMFGLVRKQPFSGLASREVFRDGRWQQR